ncbi:MAG: hypothetical protein CVU00_10210 [Bacteroidetes bacterium HGW-Bacteroidetes-17]|jgi:hypothetical protein|nr:MAG: hypothetical protein CVU00_10210 [Bacteroidetes bacterium HGW-Bacteroidetes-17]
MNTKNDPNYTKLIYLLLFLFIVIQQAGFAQGDASSKQITAVKLNEKVTIDGILSENVWKRTGFDEFFQQEPNQGENASQRTEVWLAYDNDAIYYAAKYYDPSPDSILARLVRRDFVWGDPSDGTVLYLDSYGDKRNGYFFYVNAAGTLADGLLENDSKQTDLSWDAVWEGVPHIDSDGWSVEIKIPFSQLRFKKEGEQIWGVNVERYISRKAETVMIAYTPRNENGFASRFPSLLGIEGLTTSSHFELLPYTTAKAAYVGNDKNNPFNPGHKYSTGAGIDIRAGLGSSLTLNATVNPDFGQVEVDPAVVNLTDVETAFQEKRPFFTEGVNIYRFGNGGTNSVRNFNWPGANIFYSRRIGRAPQGPVPANDYADVPNGTSILGATKISGRLKNGWKVGTVHALTQRESASIDISGQQSKSEVEPQSYYGVLRLQRDFNGGKQGIGILSTYTNRFFKNPELKNYINKDALVAGVDGWFFLDSQRTYVLTGWVAGSNVNGDKNRMIALQRGAGHYFQRPDVEYIKVDSSATSMTGLAGRLMLNKNRGRFVFNTAVGFLSPEFEVNDLGYGSYSDLINMHWAMNYRFTTPTKYYQSAGLNTATYASFDFGGNKTGQGFFAGGFITFRNLSGVNMNFSYNPESLNSRRTRGGPLTLNPSSRSFNFNVNSDNRKWWVFNAGGFTNNGDNANSKAIFSNVEFKVSTSFTLQVGLELSKDEYHAQWVRGINDPLASDTYGKRYVFANLDQTVLASEIRMDWILKPNLSFQIYLQPYIVSGEYAEFKALQKPKTFDFLKYGTNGSTIIENKSAEGDILSYTVDADGSGPSNATTISNPNFNYVSLRGNAVLRWEYRKGSTLYLVWTQSRETMNPDGEFNLGNSFESMFNTKADNIFMLKFSYWF